MFLREEDLRQGIELLVYAYRDFTTEAEAMLLQYGFGRAHHRVIYFVGRNPGMPVAALTDETMESTKGLLKSMKSKTAQTAAPLSPSP